MADPEGAGTWDDAAVADLPGPNAEGRAFGFDSGSPYALRGRVVLAGGRGLSSYTDDVLTYHVVTNSYSADFPDLNQARRNHAGVFAPVPFPRMWVFGGFAGYDYPPFAKAEYFTLSRFTPPALPGVRLLLLSN
jgi:hypothetical protein